MTSKEEAFIQELESLFKLESAEHLKTISDGLLKLEENTGGPIDETVDEVFRAAHSLKGGARAVNQPFIQDVCQEFETTLAQLREKKIALSPELFSLLYHTLKVIGQTIEEKTGNSEQLDALKNKLKAFNLGEKVEVEEEVLPAPIVPKKSDAKTIRVSVDKLDSLMQKIEEMLILKLISEQRIQSLLSIQANVRDWEKEWFRIERHMRLAALSSEKGTFSEGEKKEIFQLISKQTTHIKDLGEKIYGTIKNRYLDFQLTNTMIDSLLEDTKKLLMQPFSSLFDIFPSMVRDISKSVGKSITLRMEGGGIEVDRRILEEIKDPLIHLIRNSIDHGIESEKEREAAKKPTKGLLTLSVSQQSGSTVQINISDDGKGINSDKVKQSAVDAGHLTQSDVANLSEEESLMLIFRSGISTSPIITDLSGRGVGLGIVMEKVEKLGGSIKVETKINEGTSFRLTLPLTLATFRGVQVLASGQTFIVPTQHINRILRVTKDSVHTVEGKTTITVDGNVLQFEPLSSLLGLSHSEQADTPFSYLIVFKVLEVSFAVGVDEVQNEQEVFVKGLGKQLNRLKNISSATIVEGGKVVPILDPFDLVKNLKSPLRQGKSLPKKESAAKKEILVVDDSTTSRMLLKNILESAGYIVSTAIDGVDAFTLLKTKPFHLVVSDVEMPRLDGFSLTEKIRTDTGFKSLPVILVTSRGSKEDREHGIDVGANAYIDKSNFKQSSLLEIVKKFI